MSLRHMWRAVAAALAITTLVATPTFADEPEEAPAQDTSAQGTSAQGAAQDTSATTAAPSTTVEVAVEPPSTAIATGTDDTGNDNTGNDDTANDGAAGIDPTDTTVAPAHDSSAPAPSAPDDAPDSSDPATDDTAPASSTTPPAPTTGTSLPESDSGAQTSTTPTNTSGSNTSESNTSQSGSTGTSSNTSGSGSGHSGSGQPTSSHESEHSVEITSIQVSVADTGNNTSTAGGSTGGQAPATQSGSQLTTGSASAIGSRDSTQLVQQAITELTNGASAEIIQISIAFNIGAAVANSGTNALSNGSGVASASITSGNAMAIGNDSQTFVTQGAAASAGNAAADSAQQSTMVLHLGVARSNTGANTIIATVSSTGAGSVGTGDASAIGNQSTTEIEQLAQAVGTNGGELTIRQRATVINLGLALADSGSNAIGGALAAAIDTGDAADFEQLLALILPELLRTALPAPEAAGPDSAPSGSATTGDALAIGNRSTTAVRQVALGAADGGTVEIGQDVVVVNAGVASATTGRNAIGSEVGSTLDPESQVVVTQLAVFLSNLLDRIDDWSSGEEVELEGDSLSASLGGLTIGLDSSLASNVLSGDAASGATIRQLTAVINLAFALANTGHNTQTVTASGTASGAATNGGSDSTLAVASLGAADAVPQALSAVPQASSVSTVIVTGNASAANSMLVVVCQLSNADLTCLGPEPEEQEPPTTTQPPAVEQPVTPTPTTPEQPAEVPSQPIAADDPEVEQTPDPEPQPQAARQGLLAITGGEPATVLRMGAVLVLAGLTLSAAARRRAPRSRAAA